MNGSQHVQPNHIRRSQLALTVALHAVALVVWGLHLYVRTLPPTATPIPGPDDAEAAWWGLWPITYAPAWFIWLGTATLLTFIVLAWLHHFRIIYAPDAAQKSALRTPHSALIISLLLFAAFFAFSIVHTRWGDAYMLTHGMAWPDPALRLVYSWQAPLDVLLHSQLWRIMGEPRGWETATPVYRLLSPLAGGLYLLIILALSRDRRLAPGWLTYGLLVTLGLIQLFFGYVENYSFAAVGVLAYLWLGIGVLNGHRPLWLAASVLALTNATHPSTVVLAPSLLYLGWRVFRTRPTDSPRNKTILAVVFQIGLPMLLVAGATIAIMTAGGHGLQAMLTDDRPGGGDARWLVPLFATSTRWEQYVMFSWSHLRDFFNEQLLVAPVVLPSLIIVVGYLIVMRKEIGDWRSEIEMNTVSTQSQIPNPQSAVPIFLTIATIAYLLFTWLWNPDYGGQRDWDLFSLAALPTTLLLIVLLPRALTRRRTLVAGAVPLIMVQGMHTAAWIFQNTQPWSWPK